MEWGDGVDTLSRLSRDVGVEGAGVEPPPGNRPDPLDSTLADAHLALGGSLDLRLRFRDALDEYRRAVTLDPSSVTAHHFLGFSLLNLGYTDDALVELRHASQLDPLAVTPTSALGYALLIARRFPESIEASRRVLSLDSTFPLAIYGLGLAQAFSAQADASVQTLERGARLYPRDSRIASALLFAYAAAGRWPDGDRMRAHLHQPGTDAFDGQAAIGDLVFGDAEPLLRLLTSEAGQRRFIYNGGAIGCNPLFDPLWKSARFRTATRKLTIQPCGLARPWPMSTSSKPIS